MVAFLMVPALASANDAMSRREGFLLLWRSIQRPSFDVHEQSFSDVQEGESGFQEITYAKNRGILDDEPAFFPDDALTQHDALLWLFRTRNIAELPDMQKKHLPQLLERYPIATLDLGAVISSQEELLGLMQALDKKLTEEVHEISLYGENFHGDGTAFGETFDMHTLTAAHRSFPHNTRVKVTNVENGKSVIVRINDRGPYVEGRDMDLSLAAFLAIAERSKGVIDARFERLGDAELTDHCGENGPPPFFQRRVTRDVHFHRGVPQSWTVGEAIVLASTRWFVVRGITYPDGTFVRMQDFVAPEEKFSFLPSDAGMYVFTFGTTEGRRRQMRMEVTNC